jgi:hypothetical protein
MHKHIIAMSILGIGERAWSWMHIAMSILGIGERAWSWMCIALFTGWVVFKYYISNHFLLNGLNKFFS